MSIPRPFSAPRVAFPGQFPKQINEKMSLEQLQSLHSSVLTQSISETTLFSKISACSMDSIENALELLSILTSFLVFIQNEVPDMIVAPLSDLIQHEDEIVQRSCLQIFALLNRKKELKKVLSKIAEDFMDWNRKSQENLFSFAFSFKSSDLEPWTVLLDQAEHLASSNDPNLSSAAEDFVNWVTPSVSKYSHEKQASSSERQQFSPSDERRSASEEQNMSASDVQRPVPEERHTPPSEMRSALEERHSPEEEPRTLDFNNYRMTESLHNTTMKYSSSYVGFGRDSSSSPKYDPLVSTESPKRTVKKIPTRKSVPSPEKATPSRKQKTKPTPKSIPELVDQLKNPDWEKQQEAVDLIKAAADAKNPDVATIKSEGWLNLLDLIHTPRTMLSNSSIKLALLVFEEYTAQVNPHASQWISVCLFLVCSSHQFIADGAFQLLTTISKRCPKTRTLKSFIVGLKHKNPIARGAAALCICEIAKNTQFTDTEMVDSISSLAKLVRDPRSETRDAVRNALMALASDSRFAKIAKTAFGSAVDYAEFQRLL